MVILAHYSAFLLFLALLTLCAPFCHSGERQDHNIAHPNNNGIYKTYHSQLGPLSFCTFSYSRRFATKKIAKFKLEDCHNEGFEPKVHTFRDGTMMVRDTLKEDLQLQIHQECYKIQIDVIARAIKEPQDALDKLFTKGEARTFLQRHTHYVVLFAPVSPWL